MATAKSYRDRRNNRAHTVAMICALVVSAVAGCDASGVRAAQASAALAELQVLRDRLTASLDTTNQQLARGETTLAWMEERDESGSTALVDGLRELSRAPALPSGTGLQHDLQLRDAVASSELISLDRSLGQSSSVGQLALEHYRRGLERHLSPGMWRYIVRGEQGRFALDFRATVFRLDSLGFEAEIRSALRGLEERRSFLEHRLDEVDRLIIRLSREGGA